MFGPGKFLENFGIFGPCGPHFWSERKSHQSSFVIIFDELSNAFFFRFSLRHSGAELDGGGQLVAPPPPRHGEGGAEHRHGAG